MGAQAHAEGRRRGAARPRRLALAFLAAVVSSLLVAQTASATFHLISIREVYAGGASNDSYVVLQAYEPGQNLLTGHAVTAYNAAGGAIGTFTFSGGVSNAANQMTVLVADSSYSTGFPAGPAPDATMSDLDLAAAGGAVCWAEVDCASWGSFSGVTTPSAGTPAVAMSGGQALRRSIAAGCSTYLEVSDDTNMSAADFSLQTPHPRANGSPIEETPCTAPNTTIVAKPTNPTASSSAEFTFTASPAAEATFECKRDGDPGFAACTSPKMYSGLAVEGSVVQHSFEVRAVHPVNGADPTPARYEWSVDRLAPVTTIGTPKPPDPNPGASVTFKFSANESGVSFLCSLAKSPAADSFSGCSGSGKTYSSLTNGSYTFKVHGTDSVGNVGADASYPFTVDTSLQDTTPPETTITSKPADPSSSTTAGFAYESSEVGSTFECKMDAGAFTACDAGGITYTALSEGQHSFQVRATDMSANTDPTPAGYSFAIVLPVVQPPDQMAPPAPASGPPAQPRIAPQTKITRKPPAKTADRTPTFKFRSSVAGASYVCKLDGKTVKRCRSPLTTKKLSFGRHLLKVAAVAGGVRDRTPAKVAFKVIRPKR